MKVGMCRVTWTPVEDANHLVHLRSLISAIAVRPEKLLILAYPQSACRSDCEQAKTDLNLFGRTYH